MDKAETDIICISSENLKLDYFYPTSISVQLSSLVVRGTMKKGDHVKVELYGVVGSAGSYCINLPAAKIEIGSLIKFQNRQYEVISKVLIGDKQYAVNVVSLNY